MGRLLAKFPQQRIRAGEKHPTFEKVLKLFKYMDELGLNLSFYRDRVFVSDRSRKNDKDWEIRDIVNNTFLKELPCNFGQYKITQDINVSPKEAQPAPRGSLKKRIVKKLIPRYASNKPGTGYPI